MAWTAAQQRAIDARGKNLLVAAAAGSGKTAVLVERIIQQILAGECDVDRLLVVTFTHAAAEEMSSRIEAALQKQLLLEQDGEKLAYLERQLVLLSGAAISTLHSFCQQLLRQHFSEIDLDPQFRIASEQELKLMKQDVIEDLFERKYEEGSASFLRFADSFGGTERGDEKLYAMVLRLYEFSQSQPFPEQWLREQADSFSLEQVEGLADTPWYPTVLQSLRLTLAEARENCEQAMEALEVLAVEEYLPVFRQEQALLLSLEKLASVGNWQDLYQAFQSLHFDRLPSVRGLEPDVKEALALGVKAPRDRYKNALGYWKEIFFSVTEEEMMEDLRAAAPEVRELCDLVCLFGQEFTAAKREKVIADFNDLEHLALQILCPTGEKDDKGQLLPSETAKKLQQRFQAVMVDEYQDTNGVQEAILQLVASPEAPNLFAVGDVKQSIYRFRLADPTLFLGKYHSYPSLGDSYERIDLAQNFRSRPEVLSAINFLFAQLMTPETMELAYDDAAALHPGPDYPPCDGKSLAGPAELVVIYDDGQEEEAPPQEGDTEEEAGEGEFESLVGLEREAQFIADRIHALMEEGVRVFDKTSKSYRPLHYRDIVILLRSLKGKAERLLEVLRSNNIPAYAAMDAGYFEEQEVRIILSLLSVLDNARQDIPLAAVLVSPIGGMTLSELAEIRLAAPEEDFFAALLKSGQPESGIRPELAQKAGNILAKIAVWRNLAQELSVPELIWQLYRDTGYYDYVGGLPGGLLRQANLRMLVDRATEYEQTNFRGLFRFLRFVQRMQDMDTDLAVARTLGESEDVVRIMTVHKSKGLEFPIVFLADMGKGFNLMDSKDMLLMHRSLGLGPYRIVEHEPLRYATFAWHGISGKLVQESKAEELRVLYVALTRAREKLILVGSAGPEKKLAARADRWCRYVPRSSVRVPEHASLAAGSFLDWVCMALSRHPAGEALRQCSSHPQAPAAFIDYRDDSKWQVSFYPASSFQGKKIAKAGEDRILAAVRQHEALPGSPCQEVVHKFLDWSYDMWGLEGIPAKFSVTELKRRFAERDAEAQPMIRLEKRIWKRPQFLQGDRMSGTEFGTLMHSVMQHIDITAGLDTEGIQKQLARMVEQEVLLPEQAAAVQIRNVQRFFRSALGKRFLGAKMYWRELPFSRMIPAGQFYEGAAAEQEQLFVQGVIDLLFEEADGKLVLVDYKTDRDTTADKVRERYRLQIDLYSQAVTEILGRGIAERYLYMLHDGSMIAM